VTIEQILFVGHDLTAKHLTPLSVPYMKMVSHLPQVNYVAPCLVCSTSNEKDPFSVWSLSLDLDPVVDMVNHSVGDLET
jgi:hypothetical protein